MKILEERVILEELEVQLQIGIHDHERAGKQRVLVTVEALLSDHKAEMADDISEALDYDPIHRFICDLAEREAFDLHEVFCRRIASFVLALPGVAEVVVQSRKPDIFPDCKAVGVRLRAAAA